MKRSQHLNTQFETALNKTARTTRLSDEARERGRMRLLAHMNASAVTTGASSPSPRRRNGAALFANLLRAMPMPLVAASLIGITLLGGGGAAAYFAQDALPGDPLYPIKINLNERVESALAFGTEAQGEMSARHAERRLAEAVELASRHQLREQVATIIETNFQRHLDHVERVISQLEEAGNDEAAARLQSHLEARLAAHEELLHRFQEDESQQVDQNTVARFRTHIEQETQEFRSIREQLEERLQRADEAPARQRIAQSTYEAATKSLGEVGGYLVRSKEKIDRSAYDSAWEDIEKARKLIGEGKRLMEAGSYGEAYTNFTEANHLIARATVTINVSLRLNLYGDKKRERSEEDPSLERSDEASGSIRVQLDELLQL